MRNKKYYPFERNQYFYGKLMTVRDFEDEQRYTSDKQRMYAQLTVGAGVVAGLSVTVIDEQTLSIEAGLALDAMGREIVVEEAVTKKLGVIEGFNALGDFSSVYLCLAYCEQQEEPVPAALGIADGSGERTSYNRVRETYRLLLMDRVVDEALLTPHFLMQEKQIVYEDYGVRITHIVPRFASGNEPIHLKVRIERQGMPRPLEVDYHCSLAYLKTAAGETDLQIYCRDEEAQAYKTLELSYELYADSVAEGVGVISVCASGGRIAIGSSSYPVASPVTGTVRIASADVNGQIIRSYLSRNFDDMALGGAEQYIYLAKLRLIRQDLHYAIESFEPLPFKQYVLSNAMLAMLLERQRTAALAVPAAAVAPEASQAYREAAAAQSGMPEERCMASGEEMIELTKDMKQKKTHYSVERAHGLGPGDVMITIAVEDIYDSSIFDTKKSVFGDASVFDDGLYEPAIGNYTAGILSYTDRGTFRVGIRFQKEIKVPAVKIKWWAVRTEVSREDSIEEMIKVGISIEPNTVSLAPRGKIKFKAVISGTDQTECHWRVVEPDGGEIDFNGVYDAPSKSGVYEIVAESVRYPGKKASTFAIVIES